ncbi:MAG TPA: alpha/beta hydrolase [Acidimicrobiales bacterium]|nr:alpha/beta hydrolase [Acidimicrobiales bacterium]
MSGLRHRTVRTNGIEMHIAEQGDGRPVILCHGFPELWYSWRHQLPALAAAGYHVVAPDQRGYGDTTKPKSVDEYDIGHLTDDMLGLLDVLGEDKAVFVGHDWGAPVVWNLAQRAPDRVEAVVGMSVPFTPRSDTKPTDVWKFLFTDTWFYILYFQDPGVADADLSADPKTFLRRFLYTISGDALDDAMSGLMSERDGRGMVARLAEPPDGALPAWLTEDDLNTFTSAYEKSGFSGGLNWYRNFDRNWVRSVAWADRKIEMPALFIAGDKDPVIRMVSPDAMRDWVTDLRGLTLLPGAGHWIQQERPDDVNRALVEFLDGLPETT